MDNNEAHEHTINLQTKLTEAQGEITRLKADRDRLRGALKSIANDDMAVCDSCDAYQETARAALEGGGHERT